MNSAAAGLFALVKWRRRPLQSTEPATQVEQRVIGKSGPDLAGVDELVPVIVADQECPQSGAGALRLGKTTDYELLPAEAFDLHPGRGPATDVPARNQLGNDPLIAAATGGAEPGYAVARLRFGPPHTVRPADRPAEQSFPLGEGLAGHVPAVEPENVEEIDVSRKSLGACLDFGSPCEMESLLNHAEARLPGFVETHDFAVHDRRLAEALP